MSIAGTKVASERDKAAAHRLLADHAAGSMKISRIDATVVSVATKRPCASAMGSGSGVTKTIIEVHTDAGLIGLGETAGALPAAIVERKFAPRLLGLDPRDRRAARRACVATYRDYGTPMHAAEVEAYAGIEIALWDIAAKACGLPLYGYLGGAVREAAPFAAYAYTVEDTGTAAEGAVPEQMARIAREQIAATGAGLFEFKIGRHSVDCDIATVLAVREALGPDVHIAVDANMRYTQDGLRRFTKAVRSAGLENFEEPLPQLADMARYRRDFGIPVSTHFTDPVWFAALPEVDGVVAGVDAEGGVESILSLSSAVRAHGKRFWLRSCVELGIAWAAMVHVVMACPAIDRPSQALIQWIDDDLIEGETWLLRGGGVRPPDRPGLGVKLDRQALELHAERYRTQGEIGYFDKS